jgi:hypothetical protein
VTHPMASSPARILEPLVDGPRLAPSPERRLLIAILEDAITCFEKNHPADSRHANRMFREAQEWIMSEQYDGPFSFENICSVLGLDPDAVRRSLRREPAEGGSAGRVISSLRTLAHK